MINVVTRSGTEQLRGSFSFFARDSAWQGLPATYDRSNGESFPFDRQQMAGAAGGALVPGKAFWFAAAEYRNQDGAVLVGERDVAARAIRRSFAAAPLDDTLGSGRVDWRPNGADALSVRYAGERAEDTGASSLDRAIGSASYRQRSRNSYQSVVGTWTRVMSPTLVNAATVSFSTFDNAIAPVAAGPQYTFPSMLDGSSFRVPQGTTQKRFQLADTLTLSRGAHSIRVGGEWQRVNADFDLGVFQDGRLEFVEDFPELRQQRRRPRRRWRPAVRGDAAQRQARSGAGDSGRRQRLRLAVRAGRLAPAARPDAQRRVCATRWTPTSRTSVGSTRSTRSSSHSCRAREVAT